MGKERNSLLDFVELNRALGGNGTTAFAKSNTIAEQKLKSPPPNNPRRQLNAIQNGDNPPAASVENYAPENMFERRIYRDPDQPLMDLLTIFQAIWQLKFLILGAGLAGALIAVIVALATPHKYYAQSQILLDPREIELTNSQIGNLQTSSEVVLALVDSQMEILTSTPVLERVIDALDLAQNAEFNGASGIQIFVAPGDHDKRKSALAYLRKNVSTMRNSETFIFEVGMKSQDPELAATIADQIIAEALLEFATQKSDFFERTSQSISARLGQLKERLDSAEQAIVDFKSANELIDVGGGVINEKEMLALSDELARVRAEQIAMNVSVNQLKTASVSGVLSGAFPEAAIGATLVELRTQFSAAKAQADSLSVALGPKHPTFIAAEKSVQAIENEVSNELRRIISLTQANLARAERSEGQLVAQLEILKARASDQSSENVGLRALEREADSIRQIYEQLLNKSRETNAQSQLSTSNVSIISQAEVPINPISRSRKVTVILGGIMGGLLALGIAILKGMVVSLRQNLASPYNRPHRLNIGSGHAKIKGQSTGQAHAEQPITGQHGLPPQEPFSPYMPNSQSMDADLDGVERNARHRTVPARAFAAQAAAAQVSQAQSVPFQPVSLEQTMPQPTQEPYWSGNSGHIGVAQNASHQDIEIEKARRHVRELRAKLENWVNKSS